MQDSSMEEGENQTEESGHLVSVLQLFFMYFIVLFQEYEETCLFTKHESLQGDSPRVHPNILKCSFHSLVTKGIRLVGFATRAMVRESPTHCLILNSLAFARGRVILRSHFLILLLLIILISHHIHSSLFLLQCYNYFVIIVYVFYSRVWWILMDKYVYMDFRGIAFLALMADKFKPGSPPR